MLLLNVHKRNQLPLTFRLQKGCHVPKLPKIYPSYHSISPSPFFLGGQLSIPHFEQGVIRKKSAAYASCQKKTLQKNIALAQFQMMILPCFNQTTNQCCFGNSDRPTVNKVLISTSLTVQY